MQSLSPLFFASLFSTPLLLSFLRPSHLLFISLLLLHLLLLHLLHLHLSSTSSSTSFFSTSSSSSTTSSSSSFSSSQCADSLAEFFKWTVKQTSKRELAANNACSELISRLLVLAVHPDEMKRLGAASTLCKIYK
jgi:hypothetical protein